MALLLLSLGLRLVSAQELNPRAIVQKSYDMAKVSGVWYSVSMASDDMKRIEENGDLRVFIRNIESLKDGGLRFHFLFMVHGECVQVAVVCERTEKDGEYAVSYEGDNKVLLLETDYKLYITFHLRNMRNGTDTNVLALYGTTHLLTPPICRGGGWPGPSGTPSSGPHTRLPPACLYTVKSRRGLWGTPTWHSPCLCSGHPPSALALPKSP
ncbi:epididymal-specific lipocalin-9-like isoform X1 [Eumetopias jubatus]|uniref:epididymal-specific lipocalin-9-like isoform X1 n=1 Tax=Eumetopias jubatus TaxID=34886 RepID=UPI00101706BD|nr:epididymal-specific lipocalin-9-like isoform X1 [Eumetopias jubatus]